MQRCIMIFPFPFPRRRGGPGRHEGAPVRRIADESDQEGCGHVAHENENGRPREIVQAGKVHGGQKSREESGVRPLEHEGPVHDGGHQHDRDQAEQDHPARSQGTPRSRQAPGEGLSERREIEHRGDHEGHGVAGGFLFPGGPAMAVPFLDETEGEAHEDEGQADEYDDPRHGVEGRQNAAEVLFAGFPSQELVHDGRAVSGTGRVHSLFGHVIPPLGAVRFPVHPVRPPRSAPWKRDGRRRGGPARSRRPGGRRRGIRR